MSNSEKNWRPQITPGDFFQQQEKRLQQNERRPRINRAADLVGPGIDAYARRLDDLNNVLATYNGYFYANGDALNNPTGGGDPDCGRLRASGTYTGNSSSATVVGDVPLADDDDATFIESDEDEFSYTVGLQVLDLDSYVPGGFLKLHIRLSITGDGPVPGEAQVFIATDAPGVDEIGGFSDGAVSGFGFEVPLVDGTIQDLVVDLSMGAWSPNVLADVVTALSAGAYLDFNDISNPGWDTPPVVRVYEAWVEYESDCPSGQVVIGFVSTGAINGGVQVFYPVTSDYTGGRYERVFVRAPFDSTVITFGDWVNCGCGGGGSTLTAVQTTVTISMSGDLTETVPAATVEETIQVFWDGIALAPSEYDFVGTTLTITDPGWLSGDAVWFNYFYTA